MTTQDNLRIVRRITFVKSNMLSRLRDFVRMNPPIFLCYKVGNDPEEFIDEVYNIVHSMNITSMENSRSLHVNWKMILNFGIHNGKSIGRLTWVLLGGNSFKKLSLESTSPVRGWRLW